MRNVLLDLDALKRIVKRSATEAARAEIKRQIECQHPDLSITITGCEIKHIILDFDDDIADGFAEAGMKVVWI